MMQLLVGRLGEVTAAAAATCGRVLNGAPVEAAEKAAGLGREASLGLGGRVESTADGVLVEEHGGDQLQLVQQRRPVLTRQLGQQAHVLHT